MITLKYPKFITCCLFFVLACGRVPQHAMPTPTLPPMAKGDNAGPPPLQPSSPTPRHSSTSGALWLQWEKEMETFWEQLQWKMPSPPPMTSETTNTTNTTNHWNELGIYGASAFAALYGIKKIINYRTTGDWRASNAQFAFFPSLDQRAADQQKLRPQLQRWHRQWQSRPLTSDENELVNNLLAQLEQDLQQIARSLQQSHCHHHQCEGHQHQITEQQPLPKDFIRFSSAIARDFYLEMVFPVLALFRSLKDAEQRRQLINFLRLSKGKMQGEMGKSVYWWGGLMVLGQVTWESMESLLMPAGSHLFCHVGNTLVALGVTSLYTFSYCYFNSRQLSENLQWSQRWKIILKTISLQRQLWQHQQQTYHLPENSSMLARLLWMHYYLQGKIDQLLAQALDLQQITKEQATKQIQRSGNLKKDVNELLLRLGQYELFPDQPNSLAQRLADYTSKLHNYFAQLDQLIMQSTCKSMVFQVIGPSMRATGL